MLNALFNFSSTISVSTTSAGSSVSSIHQIIALIYLPFVSHAQLETICTSLEFTRLSIFKSNDTLTIV